MTQPGVTWSLKEQTGEEVNIAHYTELLQNDIWLDVQWKLWNFREREAGKFASTYGACNHIMTLIEKTIKHTIEEI